jgi:hypothetical protein
LLLSAFEALGDKDSFSGTSLLSKEVDHQRKYLVDEDWKRLFEYEQARCRPGDTTENLLLSINHLGYHGILEKFIIGKMHSSGKPLNTEESEYLYEALWRNGQWSLPVSTTQIGIKLHI